MHFQCNYLYLHNASLNIDDINKNCKNTMKSEIMSFTVKNRDRKLKIGQKATAQNYDCKKVSKHYFQVEELFNFF